MSHRQREWPSTAPRRTTRSATNKRSPPPDDQDITTLPTSKSRSKPRARDTRTPATSKRAGPARSRGTFSYTHHIAFYGGVLSNFHRGTPFHGASILAHLLPQLSQLALPPYPSPTSLATHLISTRAFLCGEQFMMAMKAYLFECPSLPTMMNPPPTADEAGSTLSSDSYPGLKGGATTLLRILRATDPRAMKALGRQCPGFDPQVWDRASPKVVMAACLARAEVDGQLAAVYRENLDMISDVTGDGEGGGGKEAKEVKLKRKFVEGSPSDRVWGVGLAVDNPNIDDEGNWRGENRLGKCHDEACLAWGRGRMGGGRSELQAVADGEGRDEAEEPAGEEEGGVSVVEGDGKE